MKKKKVFVVDDDSSARGGLARLLATAGYEVKACSSADEFLLISDEETSGCVVLDARMPGFSNEELKKRLTARGIDLPLIVISADDDPETHQRAQALGATGFFRKPVDGIAVLDAVKWAMRPQENKEKGKR